MGPSMPTNESVYSIPPVTWRFAVVIVLISTLVVPAAFADLEAGDDQFSGPTGPIVTRIAWTGVEAMPEDDLEDRIVTAAQPRFELRFWKAKRRLDEFALEEDIDRILEVYAEIGFFSATAEARVSDPLADRTAIEFIVQEGPRVRLQAWTLEILTQTEEPSPPEDVELDLLRRHVAFLPNRAFGSKLYRDRRVALLRECGELGFPAARIRGGASIDLETSLAQVSWNLDLGPRTKIGSIRIEGLERVEQRIVRRELLFEEGARFSNSSIEKSERRLVATGLFRSAAIGRARTNEPGTDDTIDLAIRLDEAPPRSFRASIGYGTEDGPRGEVSLGWRNFLGDARQLNLRGFASLLDAGFEVSLGQPYVWGDLARADLAVSALRQERPGYEAFLTGASGLMTFYPDRDGPWSVTIGPGVELAQILSFEIDVGEQTRGPRQSLIVNWFTVARYQRIDDKLNPRSGISIELHNELGGFPIGSDLDYHRWHLVTRLYQPTGPLVWAFRAAVSSLDPIGDGLPAVPLTRRLYSGGTNSIRGYGFQKLGPKDSDNDPIGGLSRMELGVELRIPIWGPVGLVGFVDAGDVRTDPFSWRPRDLRASAGPGVRFDTPVGPLRFDFGWLLNRTRNSDPWRFHLSVGHAF